MTVCWLPLEDIAVMVTAVLTCGVTVGEALLHPTKKAVHAQPRMTTASGPRRAFGSRRRRRNSSTENGSTVARASVGRFR